MPSQQESNGDKKGGVDLSAFHATQGRRIVVRNLLTIRPVSWRVREGGKFFENFPRGHLTAELRRRPERCNVVRGSGLAFSAHP